MNNLLLYSSFLSHFFGNGGQYALRTISFKCDTNFQFRSTYRTHNHTRVEATGSFNSNTNNDKKYMVNYKQDIPQFG